MTYSISDFFLEFRTPFTIAHGTRSGTNIVLLTVEHKGIKAFGEASLPPYLPENNNSVRKFIQNFFESTKDLFSNLEVSLKNLHNHHEGNYSAKACVDIALHNWFAAEAGIPVWKLLNLKNHPLPFCTFTIGMDKESVIQEKIIEANDFHILKIKMGMSDDKEFISIIRKYTDKPICVDANQGWKNKEVALEMIHWLKENNAIFVEQPLPKASAEDQLWLFEKSPLPLYADESVQTPEDIITIKDRFHGINIKLMKCGGISEAMKMIHLAKKYQLQVMIGSMSETGCAISAASQLSSLADWCDLDGPLLTKNNPFDNITYRDGKLQLD